MNGPVITVAGQQLEFGSDGNVADNATGNALGAWTSISDQKDNQIRYQVSGADQAPLLAKYGFDPDTNMLQMQLASPDGSVSSDLFSFIGGIEVDEQGDLNYFLVDNTGAQTGVDIKLYGTISFAQDTNNLAIALTGGGTAEVQGLSGIQSLTAAENNIAQFTGNDLLTFAAETDNVIPGSDDPLVVPAVINYTGNWDIQNGSLLFVGNVQTATGAPATVQLAFAGKVAGVTAGFAYFSDAAGTELAFNVTGQHVFNAGTLTWSSSIGFSAKGFDATVAIADHQQIGDSTLAIQGSLTLTDASGSQPSLQLSLQADYAPDQHGVLVFNAKVDVGGPTPSYDLMLTGTYQYSNLTLTFSIDYTNQAGAPDVSVAVGIQGNKNSIIQFLQVILNISGSDVELKLALTFSVRLQFENGVRVNVAPSAPAPLAPPTDPTADAAVAGKVE
jgi:hypothetical protein